MNNKFVTVLADPPWPYNSPAAIVGNAGRGSQGGKAALMTQVNVHHHYATMSMQAIKNLDVKSLVEPNAQPLRSGQNRRKRRHDSQGGAENPPEKQTKEHPGRLG